MSATELNTQPGTQRPLYHTLAIKSHQMDMLVKIRKPDLTHIKFESIRGCVHTAIYQE